jgi:uncharacterized protein YbaP (TraB family)
VTIGYAETTSAIKNPFFYEIRKGHQVSWILGTLHFGIDYSELKELVEPKIKSARLFYFEFADPKRSRMWVTNPIEALVTSPDSDLNVGDDLDEQTRRRLVNDFGIDSGIAHQMHSGSCIAFGIAMDIKKPMLDHQLVTLVDSMNKEMRDLDTDQLRAEAKNLNRAEFKGSHDDPSHDCNLEELYLSRMTKAEFEADEEKSVALYRSGNEVELRSFNSRGLAYRNYHWINSLLPELNRGGVFTSVGAGHLFGSHGLINLLRENGFQISRLGSK